jgi:hypothetical protein
MVFNMAFLAVFLLMSLLYFKAAKRALAVASLGGALLTAGLLALGAPFTRGGQDLIVLLLEWTGTVLFIVGVVRGGLPRRRAQ